MNTVTSGVAVYSFDGTSLTFVEDIRSDEIGSITSYLTDVMSAMGSRGS